VDGQVFLTSFGNRMAGFEQVPDYYRNQISTLTLLSAEKPGETGESACIDSV
jgi:hypothetical protein